MAAAITVARLFHIENDVMNHLAIVGFDIQSRKPDICLKWILHFDVTIVDHTGWRNFLRLGQFQNGVGFSQSPVRPVWQRRLQRIVTVDAGSAGFYPCQ